MQLPQYHTQYHSSVFPLYHFESFQSRDVQEGDSGEVQDQAVELHSGNPDVVGKLGIPVHPEWKAFEVSGLIHLLLVHARLISCFAK